MASFYDFDLHIDASLLSTEIILDCDIFAKTSGTFIGSPTVQEKERNDKVVLKRVTPPTVTRNLVCKVAKQQNLVMPKKEVSQVFKELNIVPDVGSDLQCALCAYVATQKGHLKTHYKLKHLGGADLTMICSMCQKKCTTKSNLKAHLIGVHKMTREDAVKLTN